LLRGVKLFNGVVKECKKFTRPFFLVWSLKYEEMSKVQCSAGIK